MSDKKIGKAHTQEEARRRIPQEVHRRASALSRVLMGAKPSGAPASVQKPRDR